MPPETVWTHLLISIIATIPAILAGVASVLVSLRQLKKAKETHTVVNGRVDQLVSAAEQKGQLQERLRQLEIKAKQPVYRPDDRIPGEGR